MLLPRGRSVWSCDGFYGRMWKVFLEKFYWSSMKFPSQLFSHNHRHYLYFFSYTFFISSFPLRTKRHNIRCLEMNRSWGLQVKFKRWKTLISMMKPNWRSECKVHGSCHRIIIKSFVFPQVLEHEERKLPGNSMWNRWKVTSRQPKQRSRSGGTEDDKIATKTVYGFWTSLLPQHAQIGFHISRRSRPLRIGFACLQVRARNGRKHFHF